MNTRTETLLANKECVILYDRRKKYIIYSRGNAKNYELIDLPDSLKYVQYYHNTGDLLVCCGNGVRRIFLFKPHIFYFVKENPESNVWILNHDFMISESESAPKAWRIKGNKLIPLTHSKDIIRPEFMPPHQFSLVQIQGIGKMFVTSELSIRLPMPSYILVNYPIDSKIKISEPTKREPFKNLDFSVHNISKNYLIRYSNKGSNFALFKLTDSGYKLLEEVDKHSCTVVQICFNDENSFLTLDSGGKLKIWLIDEGCLHVCQTISSDEFYKNSFYSTFTIDMNENHVILITKLRRDHYQLNIDKFNRKHKNALLVYLYSEETGITEGDQIGTKIIPDNSASSDKEEKISSRSSIKAQIREMDANSEYYGSIYLNDQKNKRFIKDRILKQQATAAISTKRDTIGLDKHNSEMPFLNDVYISSDAESKNTLAIPSNDEIEIPLRTSSRFQKQKALIYVGIDFGTSRTKVSFNNETEGRYEPLIFESLHPSGFSYSDIIDKYAIPSIALRVDSMLFYGYDAIKREGMFIQNFKQKLLSSNEQRLETMCICAGFLAYVMRIAIEQICLLTHANQDDSFVFSVCLPVERMNNNRIKNRFEFILRLAKKTLELGYHSDWEKMNSLSRNLDINYNTNLSIRTSIIPESIAEVLDFCNRKASSKLYALYDFGAGTTDLTIFYFNRQTGQAEIIEAKIIYKGYSFIDELRAEGVCNDERIYEYYCTIWNEFKESETWIKVKNKIAGFESMRLFYDVTLFGSGGGFNDLNVQKLFNRIPLYHEQTKSYIEAKSGINKLEEPIGWDVSKPPYFRYAVSFGLTKKPEETNKNFILPKDCKIRSLTTKIRNNFEPDIVYPTSDWLGR